MHEAPYVDITQNKKGPDGVRLSELIPDSDVGSTLTGYRSHLII